MKQLPFAGQDAANTVGLEFGIRRCHGSCSGLGLCLPENQLETRIARMLAASCSTLWSARAPRSSRAIRTAEPRKKLQIHALKKLSLQQNAKWAVQSLHEDIHGRRYITNVQRLRAGLHLHSCRSDVLPGTWLFDPKTLQELPSGKKERSGGLWLPFCSGHGNTRDLFGLRPADNRAV